MAMCDVTRLGLRVAGLGAFRDVRVFRAPGAMPDAGVARGRYRRRFVALCLRGAVIAVVVSDGFGLHWPPLICAVPRGLCVWCVWCVWPGQTGGCLWAPLGTLVQRLAAQIFWVVRRFGAETPLAVRRLLKHSLPFFKWH